MAFANGSHTTILREKTPHEGSPSEWPRKMKRAIATDTTASRSPFLSSPHGMTARSSR